MGSLGVLPTSAGTLTENMHDALVTAKGTFDTPGMDFLFKMLQSP